MIDYKISSPATRCKVTRKELAEAVLKYSLANANSKYSLAVARCKLDDKGLNQLVKEIMSSIDAFDRTVQYKREFLDEEVVLDSQAILDITKVLVESVSNIEQTLISFYKELSDSQITTDSFSRTVAYDRSFLDNQEQLDQHVIAYGTTKSDSQSVIESAQYYLEKVLLDSQSQIDSIQSFSIGKSIDDFQGQEDLFDRIVAYSRSYADGQSQIDYATIELGKVLSESQTQTDSLNRVVDYIRKYEDSQEQIDVYFSEFGKPLSDVQGQEDDPRIELGKGFSDTQVQNDSFDRIVSYAPSYSDSQTQTDNFSRTVAYNKYPSETPTYTEAGFVFISSDYVVTPYSYYFTEDYVGITKTF